MTIVARVPRLDFFPDVGRFDRLSEADLVSDKKPADRRLNEAHDWLELVRVEVGVARLHRIENVGQLALDFFKSEDAPKISLV